MRERLRKSLKWLLASVVGAAALAAILIAGFGVIVTRVPEYRVQVQDWINERSGLIVEFRSLRARLRLYGPELIFDDAVVRTPDRTRILATATRGSVGFDLWRALREGRLTAGRFSLDSPQIGLVRTREGRIQLLGQSALPERTDVRPFALEELPTGRFDVDDAIVTFRDEITGRGPWSVSGVDFELTRSAEELRLRGHASLPQSLGRRLSFTAIAEGPLEQYQTLVSTFSIEGEALDLAGWADVLPDRWPAPETGGGSVRVRGALRGPSLTQLSARLHLTNVAAAAPVWSIPLPEAAPPEPNSSLAAELDSAAEETPSALPQMVSYERIAFELDAQRIGDEWNATIADLELVRGGVDWRASEIGLKWARGADGRTRASGSADRIVLEAVWPLLAFLPESEALARVRALNARGVLEDVAASFERRMSESPVYEARARLSGGAFDPVGKAPGFAGLGGDIEATHEGGRWRLAPQEVRFDLPRWFRQSLSAHLEAGELTWQSSDEGWIVRGEGFRLRNEDGRAVAQLALTIPREGSPVLDMSAHGEELNVEAAAKYIPAGRLGAGAIEWFDQAFVDGRVTTADFVYRGPTRAFPFRNDEGEFRVLGHVADAVFSYQPGWTPATNVAAEVEFRNEGMHIRSSAAQVGDLKVHSADARIRDLKDGVLVINAAADGDVGQGLSFLKQSPLGPKLGEQFARLEGSGRMATKVRLYLPIKQLANRDIEVANQLTDATVALAGVDAPVRRLSGSLTVRNTLVASAALKGQWLGGPLSVDIRPDGRNASLLTAEGRATAERLEAVLQTSASLHLQGAADWRMAARLQSGAPAVVGGAQLESDTSGLAVSLPAPLGKPENEPRALQITLDLEESNGALVRASFGDVRSVARFARSRGEWRFDRAGVRADGVAPSLPDHSGLRIEGAVDRFVLDEWLALRGDGASPHEGAKLSDFLHAANVRVREFQAFGYVWPEVRGVLQAMQSGWRVDVSGASAEGQILIPEILTGEQPLRATMERLVLEKAPASERGRGDATDPRKLPGMHVYVGDLSIGARRIGAVDLKTSRVAQGVRLDSATIIGQAVRAEGRGQWLVAGDGQRSALSFRAVSDDVAATLQSLNYGPFMEAKRGEVRADVTWPGGFSGNVLAHASGSISIEAEGGQLVNVQPGAGRVLGLFSVAALPRRLALDFSDLTDKGLAFDRIHGDFELRDGHAHTSNLLLTGPAAEIGIAGRTGLGDRDYDQTAVVTGKLGASLPVAGALAGGPAVGAALLLFSQVFKEPLKGITRGYYRITGPWEDPTVERIDAAEAKGSNDS